MLKNKKTTLAAVLLLVSLVVGQVTKIVDDDPTTVPQWDLVISQIIIVIGLLFARDIPSEGEESPKKS